MDTPPQYFFQIVLIRGGVCPKIHHLPFITHHFLMSLLKKNKQTIKILRGINEK
jgi:hypothetical protein